MTPKIEFSEYSINIPHVVKCLFGNAQSLVNMTRTRSMRSEQYKWIVHCKDEITYGQIWITLSAYIFQQTKNNNFLEFSTRGSTRPVHNGHLWRRSYKRNIQDITRGINCRKRSGLKGRHHNCAETMLLSRVFHIRGSAAENVLRPSAI